MNTDNNALFKETELKIQTSYRDLIKKDPSKQPTVTDVCNYAGIHRSTFYKHFQDIPELETRFEMIQFERFFADAKKNGEFNIEDALRSQLDFYYRYRDVIKKHLSHKKTDAEDTYFNKNLINLFYDTIHTSTDIDDETFMYYQAFFYSGYYAVIRRWIFTDCRKSPEEMLGILLNLMHL